MIETCQVPNRLNDHISDTSNNPPFQADQFETECNRTCLQENHSDLEGCSVTPFPFSWELYNVYTLGPLVSLLQKGELVVTITTA